MSANLEGAKAGRSARRGTLRSPRKLTIAAALFGISALLVPTADAQNPAAQAFQLEGNATDDGDGDDWANVFLGNADVTASSFVTDGAGATTFSGGSSKDANDISSWNHKSGSVPDKDNMAHSFAARDGRFLYFGADRIANNGDAQIGFWFFQGDVTAQDGGKFGPDKHANGDILVLANFSNGGTTASTKVYKWHSPGGAIDGTLDDITPAGGATCSMTSGDACAIANGTSKTSPWPFTPKSGPAGSFQANELFEGGIDLEVLDLNGACFSSFLSETRTSTSVDSVLKDFVGGSFQVCTPELSTTPSDDVVIPGEEVFDTITITGQGAANPPTPTGTVTFFLCKIASGVCTTGGTNVGTGTLEESDPGIATADSPDVNTDDDPLAPGRYCFRAEWPGDDTYTAKAPDTEFVHFGEEDEECFVVRDVTSMLTDQDWIPNDTATITAAGDSKLTGSVTFTLYESPDCTAGPDEDDDGKPDNVVYRQVVNLPEAGVDSPAVVSTSNTTVKVVGSTTVSWSTTFTSGDPDAVVGTTGSCEVTQLMIDNNDPA